MVTWTGKLLLVGALTTIMGSGGASASEYPLAAMVRVVKSALLEVEQESEYDKLRLESALLTVKTNTVRAADGSISLSVVEVSGGGGERTTSTVELLLAPPPEDSASDVSNSEMAETLASNILAAEIAIKEADKGMPPLIPMSLKFTTQFLIEGSAKGAFKIRFPVFGIDGEGKVHSEVAHSITIHYTAD